MARRPYAFRESHEAEHNAFIIPNIASERRDYLLIGLVDNETIIPAPNFVIYDPPAWLFAILVSRLHILWIGTVCGKLETRLRYSNTLGYNTFPVPHLTKNMKEALYRSSWRILKERTRHYPATLAELYDPDKMPADLKKAHEDNDALLEGFYRKAPFKDDTERLSHLFTRYTNKMKKTA